MTYDAVVIGSGMGGAVATYALADAGLRVLLVETGDYVRPPEGMPEDRIGFTATECGLTEDPDKSCVGGPTKFYGAAMYRLRASDFARRELETGVSEAWPIRYEDLEPYYTRAEALFGVHGATDDQTEPFRSAPFPHAALPHQEPVRTLVDRMKARGVAVSSIPRALDYRGGAGACVMCSTCDAYYCRRDAKNDAETACIRPALATGRVELMTHTTCNRILLSDDGRRAVGVEIVREGVTTRVAASVVIASAGIAQTPLLLRRSKTGAHPAGLGNHHGALGRYMCGHTAALFFPLLGLSPLGPVHAKTFAINSYYEPSDDWPYPTGVIQMAGQIPIDWHRISWVMRHAAKFVAARSLVGFCMAEEPSGPEQGFSFTDADELAPGIKDPPLPVKSVKRLLRIAKRTFRQAGAKAVIDGGVLLTGWHRGGTARMGDDDRTSVLDARGRVHGIDNLYVADSCSLPSPGAVNTGLTIAALSLRLADDIAHRSR